MESPKILNSVKSNKIYGICGLLFILAVFTVQYLPAETLIFKIDLLGRLVESRAVHREHDTIPSGSITKEFKRALRNEPVGELVAALRAATKLAAGGVNESTWFTEEARAKWNAENPCLSRDELPIRYGKRNYVQDLEPSKNWQLVLREYARLHRTCTRRIGNPLEYFMAKNSSVDCKFMVIDTEDVGLGNRILMIASAFAYAVLTQRVLLISKPNVLLPGIMCEPFEGSSWMHFDPESKVLPYREGNQRWTDNTEFLKRIDEARSNPSSNPLDPISEYAVTNGDGWKVVQPDTRFFCDTEQKHYANVTWMEFTGCLYFAPKLFAVPSFRRTLNALFSDRMILTRVLRAILLPSDDVWARVKRIDSGYLQQAYKRLGIQIRYRDKGEQFNKMHTTIESRVLQCATENYLLPAIADNSQQALDQRQNRASIKTTETPVPRVTSVFIGSLFEGLKTFLIDTYLRNPTTTGDAVAVVQLSHQGEQRFGIKIDQEALAEVLVLSFSDYLFVTPISTFSGISQAYGGLRPWFIDFRETDNAGACTRAQTVDVCFQVPKTSDFTCPYDPAVNGKSIPDVYPDIQKCLDVDVSSDVRWGMQLITRDRAH